MSDTSDTEEHEGNTKPREIPDSKRARRWLWTLNNYTVEEFDTLHKKFSKEKFYIIGKEIGEKCGTPHLQGYVEFKNARSFSSMKKINRRIHWQIADGDRESNVKYCSKDEEYVKSSELTDNEVMDEIRRRMRDEAQLNWITKGFQGPFWDGSGMYDVIMN